MSSEKCLAVSHIHKSHYTLFIWIQFSFTDSMIWFLFTMMTLPNGNIFRVAGPLCEEFTGWWFQTPSRLLWRHCNDNGRLYSNMWRHDMATLSALLLLFAITTRLHYKDVTMTAMASQITSCTIVYSTIYSGVDQSKHQSPASLVFVRENHRWLVNSPHKGPVTRKMFPFDDVIMPYQIYKPVTVIYDEWKSERSKRVNKS